MTKESCTWNPSAKLKISDKEKDNIRNKNKQNLMSWISEFKKKGMHENYKDEIDIIQNYIQEKDLFWMGYNNEIHAK